MNVSHPHDPLADRLSQCYTGAVHDVMRARGLSQFVLPPQITPLESNMRTAGQAFTIRGRMDRDVSAHDSLVQWTKMLSVARPGSVVVCQPNDSTIAHMGELSAETFMLRGVRGYVVDGGCRDTSMIARLGFPVWRRYDTPSDVVGQWVPDGMDEPITIGNVTIHAGDYVLGDRDGVVILPKADTAEIIDEAERVMHTENQVRKAILDGVDPHEAYLKYGKF